jgi:transcriptional regulator with XRE-family HTH domain
MNASLTITLSEPTGSDKVPLGTLAYFRARLKQRIYSLVIKEFKKSAISQADLARRLGMDPARLSRLMSGPGNLTFETTSDLLFGISAAELNPAIAHPLSAHRETVSEAKGPVQPAQAVPSPPIRSLPRTEPNPGLIDALQEQANLPIAA